MSPTRAAHQRMQFLEPGKIYNTPDQPGALAARWHSRRPTVVGLALVIVRLVIGDARVLLARHSLACTARKNDTVA